jgi:hypothetical protein
MPCLTEGWGDAGSCLPNACARAQESGGRVDTGGQVSIKNEEFK